MDEAAVLKKFLEDAPLYQSKIFNRNSFGSRQLLLREIQSHCEYCKESKPFHNTHMKNIIIYLETNTQGDFHFPEFSCVTCYRGKKAYLLKSSQIDGEHLEIVKAGQYPQKELPRSKTLSKFFENDKSDYNKAVICLANGYGIAAFAYLRRIIEKNIIGLLDLIKESVDSESPLLEKLSVLKVTSPMSDKIEIANHALPDYLKPDGFNPLGQIYSLLSDGVHSLPDQDCLDKAQDLQACLEFLISELAAHKRNKEEFKSRLTALRKK